MKKRTGLTLIAIVLMLTSCASYTAAPLCHPSPELVQAVNKGDVSVVSKTFSQEDCFRFLDRDVISQGYQPVQIYIENNTDSLYVFSLNRISMPVVKYQDVARKVHTSTLGRVLGYTFASMFFAPFIIPAVVDGFSSSAANDELDMDFYSKTAKDQIIVPHGRINGIVFVPIDGYTDTYTITLVDPKSQKVKVFDVCSFKG